MYALNRHPLTLRAYQFCEQVYVLRKTLGGEFCAVRYFPQNVQKHR
jgi:hypothetical protein